MTVKRTVPSVATRRGQGLPTLGIIELDELADALATDLAFSIFSIYHECMTVLTDHTVLPPTNAESDMGDLATALASGRQLSLVDESGQPYLLSAELRTLLAQAIAALSAGQAVTLESLRTVLSTQEAANLLGISRPTVVKLLESGAIPFTQPGRHRRIQLQHVLEYQRQLHEHRRDELTAMTAEAADDDAYRTVNGFTRTR